MPADVYDELVTAPKTSKSIPEIALKYLKNDSKVQSKLKINMEALGNETYWLPQVRNLIVELQFFSAFSSFLVYSAILISGVELMTRYC